jgi:hypothetical protein
MQRTQSFSSFYLFVCFALYSVCKVRAIAYFSQLTADRYLRCPDTICPSEPPIALQPVNVLPIFLRTAARQSAGPLILPAGFACLPFYFSSLYLINFTRLCSFPHSGGDEGIRTPGLRRAKAALSHLSYIPKLFTFGVVGLTGFEPVTPALSAQCSNHLSYRPLF